MKPLRLRVCSLGVDERLKCFILLSVNGKNSAAGVINQLRKVEFLTGVGRETSGGQ